MQQESSDTPATTTTVRRLLGLGRRLRSPVCAARRFAKRIGVWPGRHSTLVYRIGIGSGVVAVLGGITYLSVPVSAQVLVKRPAVNRPIVVAFSHPVRSSLAYSLSPKAPGSWQTSKSIIGGVTKLTFWPAQPLRPDVTYRVALKRVQSMLGVAASGDQQIMSLTTQALQPVTLVSPQPAKPTAVDSDVVVTLPFANGGVRKLVLTSSDAPLAGSDPAAQNDRRFVWHFSAPLAQGKTYHLQLNDVNRPAGQQLLQSITFTTVSAPQVTSATTTDHLYPNQTITIVFAQAMVQNDKAFTFGCPGSGKWQDTKTYVFTPTTLVPATACAYTLQKGVRSTEGGVVEVNQQFSVSAPGAVYVLSATPSGSGLALSKTVSVTFDQPVDHTSAQSAFGLSPAVPGTFTWADNTMTFKPSPSLDYQTAYAISIKAGVVALYGLPGVAAFTQQFTTVLQTIKLAVPGYRQQYALSCEESSLRMALAYRGISVSDMDALQAVGYSPQARDAATNSWQNPYEMYVGDVSGKEGVTGWGAYGPPIAAAAQKLGRNAAYVSGISPQQISDAIHNNNPVVLWGVVSGQTPKIDSWSTDTGLVKVADNAHVRTVYGVVGNASNPLGFYLHDPLAGDVYWSTATLQANMSANGQLGSQGVVVY